MATKKAQAITATGRRKNAVARVRILPGEGKVTVNDRPFDNYFPLETLRSLALQPLKLTNLLTSYDVSALCSGGGPNGQAGAMRHGLARALILADPALRPALKAAGYLTRDPRMKERKKSGQPGARKRYQFSKR